MEQLVKTYHNYDDENVNTDIQRRARDGWTVSQIEYSSQIVHDKVRSCLIVLFERNLESKSPVL